MENIKQIIKKQIEDYNFHNIVCARSMRRKEDVEECLYEILPNIVNYIQENQEYFLEEEDE